MKQDESAHFGQKIRTETSPDKSSFNPGSAKEQLNGRDMPDRGLSHSMATQPEYADKAAAKRS